MSTESTIVRGVASVLASAYRAASQKEGIGQESKEFCDAMCNALFHAATNTTGGPDIACLVFPGPGNGTRLFNYDNAKWGGPCEPATPSGPTE